MSKSKNLLSLGSPPRMRGKVANTKSLKAIWRITPAYAGKSSGIVAFLGPHRDHPRVCGEKVNSHRNNSRVKGSPPRMRGKARVFFVHSHVFRITPAYAGKRHTAAPSGFRSRDHPRVCGEKVFLLIFQFPLLGSPPRMRGKAFWRSSLLKLLRITPAYAGKSSFVATFNIPARDHPRVCGEKLQWCFLFHHHKGSPPRMRGKDIC